MPIHVVSVPDAFANASNQTIKALVAGPPGAGKTLFGSTWPGVLYADIEGRLLSVRDRPVHSVRITSTADLEELIGLLDQDRQVRAKLLGVDVQTVVVDTIDELSKIVQNEIKQAEKVEALRMQDWGKYGDTLRGILRRMRNIDDLNVLFTVHLRASEDSETGRVEHTPAIQGQVGNEVAGYVDEAWLLVARPTTDAQGNRIVRRYIQTYPDAQYAWVKDHSGRMPMEFDLNFQDDYQRIAELIFGAKPTAPAEPEAKVAKTVKKAAGKAVPTEPPLKKQGVKASVKPAVVDVPLPEEGVSEDAVEQVVVPEPENSPLAPGDVAPTSMAVDTTEEAVPEIGTESAEPEPEPPAEDDGKPRCSECGEIVGNPTFIELSEIRYQTVLCETHYKARKERK